MFFFAKNKELLRKLEEYLGTVSDSLDVFTETMEHMLKNGMDEHFNVLVQRVHQQESRADDLRRAIEADMYKKSLLPETREDLLGIIEAIDKIPNEAEAISYDFQIQGTRLFADIRPEFAELLELSKETVALTLDATRDCFGGMGRVSELNMKVDKNESLGDALERKMITKIFASTMDTGEKILQRDLVIKLGDICDHSQGVLDKLVIAGIKRYV